MEFSKYPINISRRSRSENMKILSIASLGIFLGPKSSSRRHNATDEWPNKLKSDLSKTESDDQSVHKQFLNGLISGATTRAAKEVLLHPIDTVRARMQVNPEYNRLEVLLSDEKQRNQIFSNLYDGVSPALIGFVENIMT
jgi:hypothetical protein